MKKLALTLALLCSISASARSWIPELPDQTLLWNRLTAAMAVDSFLVGVANEGVVVYRYQASAEAFVQVNQLFVDFKPKSARMHDNNLVVRTQLDDLVFVDLSHLPQLALVGEITPPRSYADYAIHGDHIYFSRWFEGIWRYRMEEFGSFQFVDSSLKGILVTQLHVENDSLYVLDEYNGILRYDLTGPGFGSFLDYIWVPFKAASFSKQDSLFMISLKTNGVYLGRFGTPGSGIVDSISGFTSPRNTIFSDSSYILLNDRTVMIVDRDDTGDRIVVEIDGLSLRGAVAIVEGEPHLVLPARSGGLAMFNLRDPTNQIQAMYRPGPVRQLLMYDDKLFTGGPGGNPIDVYSFDDSLTAFEDYTLYPGLQDVRAMDRVGDTLVVLYGGLGKVVFIINSEVKDSFYIELSFFVDTNWTVDLIYVPAGIDSIRYLMLVRNKQIDVYALYDEGGVSLVTRWEFLIPLDAVVLKDSLLFVTNVKNELAVYRVNDHLDLELLSALGLGSAVSCITVIGDDVLLFEWTKMLRLDYSDPTAIRVDTAVMLPVAVTQTAFAGGRMYSVSPNGIGIYDLSNELPEIIEYGGRGGDWLAVDGRMLAVSNGESLHLYQLIDPGENIPAPEPIQPEEFTLSQNYPNPFNASTTIRYFLPIEETVTISVYNILGRKVKTLHDGLQSAGEQTVVWDGSNQSGGSVASGIYLYRIDAGSIRGSKKMVYLK